MKVLLGIAFGWLCGASVFGQGVYGRLDPTFHAGAGANGPVSGVRLAVDGRFYVIGQFSQCGGYPRQGVARLAHHGPVDPTYAPSPQGNQFWSSLAVQWDSQLLLAMPDRRMSSNFHRYLENGVIDTGFLFGIPEYPRFDDAPSSITTDRKGRIYVGGKFMNILVAPGIPAAQKVSRPLLARFDMSGAFDEAYRLSSNVVRGDLRCMTFTPEGKMLAGGLTTFDTGLGVWLDGPTLFRANEDGSFDTSFNSFLPEHGAVFSMAVQRDRRVLYVREYSQLGIAPHFGRLMPDGWLDDSFQVTVAPAYSIRKVLVQGDNKILIVGAFTSVNGVKRHRVARLLHNGKIDEEFDPGEGPNNEVLDVALDYNGNIVIVGRFSSVSGVPMNGIARLLGNDIAPPPTLLSPKIGGTDVRWVELPFFGLPNKFYGLEYKLSVDDDTWKPHSVRGGADWGGTFVDPNPLSPMRIYRAAILE